MIDWEERMKMYQNLGFNRLAKLIALLVFVATYTVLIVQAYSINEEQAFIVFPIVSIIGALGAFLLTRLVYWVIDGFIESKDEIL